jgi:hypothetical protein
MKDVLTSWWVPVLIVAAATVIWPETVWEWVRTLAGLPSLGAYMR